MFTVSETLEAREAKIQAFAKQDAVIGVVLAAIHLEWCLVRCFLLMGTTSSKEMLTTRASKQDKHFALDEVSSFTGYEQAWAAEIEPIVHISWEAVFESIKRPESLIPARGTVTVKRKHLLPEVTDGASCVRYAMNCRNAFVHGEKGTTSPDHAQALLEIFFAAARALNEVAISQGVSLFGRRRCRRGAFGSAPQAYVCPLRSSAMNRLRAFVCALFVALPLWLSADTWTDANGVAWSYIVSIGKASVTGIPKDTAGALTVPSTLGGYPVTSIGDDAFSGCSSLTSVVIPASVTSIGGSAFYYCTSLSSVIIPESVTSIGIGAFAGCSSLTAVTIPRGVTTISYAAFVSCSSLTSVVIPEGVTGIESSAFGWCTSLISVTIPSSVTGFGISAFQGCSSLTSVTIPEGVTGICDSAFRGCSSLTSVTIPKSVTLLGNSAFYDCSSLSEIRFEGGVPQRDGISDDLVDRALIGTYRMEYADLWTAALNSSGIWRGLTMRLRTSAISAITYVNLREATHSNPEHYTEGSEYTFLPPTEVPGYTFLGWIPEAIDASMSGDQVVSASWKANSYVIAYNANGGTGEMAGTPATYDQTVTLATNTFAHAGYTFTGWATEPAGAAVYAPGEAVTNLTTEAEGVVTLYAAWEGVPYIIAYNANGGTGEMAGTPATYDQTVALATNGFAREGYTFTGWATESVGAVVYAPGEAVTNLTAEAEGTVTLYAAWKANRYAITYNANGGTGEMAGTPATYDQTVALATNGFAREGYTFTGWATEPAGAAVYAPGEEVTNLTTMANGVVALYAAWTAVDSPVPEPEPKPDYEPPAWEIVQKGDTMVVFATVYDRVLKAAVEAEGSLLAAFSAEGECRGVTEVIDGPTGRLFLLSVSLESAIEAGFVLKVWNSATGITTEIPSVRLAANTQKQIGELTAPVSFTIGFVTQEIRLEPGWNWISTYLALDAPTLGDAFADQPFSDGDLVKSALSSSTYNGGKWYPGSFALNPGEAFLIRYTGTEALTLTFEGEPMAEAVSVCAGWNWFGLPRASATTVAKLEHSGGFVDGDLIKTATRSTTYSSGKWYPSNFALTPGEGYMAKLTNGGTLTVVEPTVAAEQE